ncbi:MAG: hypothetical protein V7780_11450 [Colwellia sp.]|jgi:hypothetical protein
MINQQLLQSSIESLKMIQEELRDDIDSSKREELNRVIDELESCKSEISAKQLLLMLGKVISWFPAIERLIRYLVEL